MLKAIETALYELGLHNGVAPLRYRISISNGSTVSVSAYLDSHRFYQIKAAESAMFEDEYCAHLCGWKKYGDLVPQPLGRTVSARWDIFVTHGVPHKPLSFAHKNHGRRLDRLLNDLNHFFRVSRTDLAPPLESISHEVFLDYLEEYFKNTSIASMATKWIARGRLLGFTRLPQIAQHGDFVLNNLAYSKEQLVIFDWEDYGKYQLPGLDICSFCFSVAPDTQSLQALMNSAAPSETAIDRFIRGACDAAGLDVGLFRLLIPLYLLTFLHAKRAYGATVQSRIRAALELLDNG